MPVLSPHLHAARLPQRAASPRRRDNQVTRELDHELSVAARPDGTVHLTINGTVEALSANQAARYASMIADAARRAGAVS
ncbi:hypothetical protein [Roseomonas xinghualingensis]|uniref:hypothetical protein n=1 Tax=Roseomonas xinghualingensis TaxID=2986475 RepID=UPI0021F119D3|nr:hypothetical protein [Roseomonas sp. SXEYE001]MCV4206890.1 hypothetical protein [Roseomonas sp. SXEYE001]